jgi:hypothetical protein
MAAIMLTRTGISGMCGPWVGWEVDYEGKVIATYVEEPGGELAQVSSSLLDRQLRGFCGDRRLLASFPDLAAMRESYLRGAEGWERSWEPVRRWPR